jgi:hypothetical protein
VLGADGVLHVLTDTRNQPLQWKPDYSTTEAALKEELAAEQNITDARTTRTKFQIRDTLPPDVPGNPMIP